MEATGAVGYMQQRPGASPRILLFLKLATFWHGFLIVASLAGIVVIWLPAMDTSTLVRLIATVLLLVSAAGSVVAVRAIPRRQHRGRVVSLVINYLWFIGFLVTAFHFLGIFIGIDALAANLARGLPFLGIAAAGFILRGFSSRAGSDIGRAGRIRRAGNIVIAGGMLVFLIAAGLLPGLLTLLSRISGLRNILLIAGGLLFGLFAVLMWRAPVATVMGETQRDNEMLNGYLFLSPNLIGFLLFFAGPLLFSLYVSFTDSDAFGSANFIGLDNYSEIFNLDLAQLDSADQLANEVIDIKIYDELTRFSIFGHHYVIGAQDKLFWISLRNTVVFVLLAVPLSVIPALLLAAVLNSKLRGMQIFRTVYFLPSVAAVVGVALIWRWLYNSTVGWLNYFIASAIDSINGLAGSELLVDPQIGWLSDTSVALLAVVIIAAWQWLGFNTVLYLAGLQNIPNVLYEAAMVDGAGALARFRRLTIPLLAPTTFFVLTTTTIQAMQIFDQVYVLTSVPGPPGGPGTSTLTMVLYLYNQGFRNFRQGYAAAIAWVLFILIFGATIFQFQRQRASGAETA